MSEFSSQHAQQAPSAAPGAAETAAAPTLQRYADAMMPLFAPSRVLVEGHGSYVTDEAGATYLDLLGGIAVNALGHGHPALVGAITEQAQHMVHVSNLFATKPQIDLAEKLLHLANAPAGSGVFFTNSGTESTEAAFKIARRTGKPRILALENAFHGRSIGALALTHKHAFRQPFEPLPGGVEFIPANDTDRLRAELKAGGVGAVIAEPIQGEAGVLPLEHDYLSAMRILTREYGALMILDEIQTGVGRTGHWFAHQEHGIQPDVMTLAKGLGGGFPMGAVIAFGEDASTLLTAGQHGTTFGGGPLAAAAGLAVLTAIEADGLLAHVRRTSEQVREQIQQLQHPVIAGVRGSGFLLGLELNEPIAADLVTAGLNRAAAPACPALAPTIGAPAAGALHPEAGGRIGFILNAPTATVLRLAPPLTTTAEDFARFTAALPALIEEVTS
ncbi:acetylornithine transaminase [Helcobacillus massiliensis]|uniref:acetylornithine transaminase n=1 Tax=Helcobacillus massiliensis TaxID=521392 RepID=UPI0021A92F4E|nr:acetylornithine transaminase [Helcobacillus massiliensis]MCT1557766.1 acetylornithine transaminase [Helcobacillus massiliensis]MCT2036996.1 acetylornithine transaminase [Helcobacillus massiliensis]MCT2332209.1 acetylornithine transaminase [Helcobacillus massiliensis]